jgi:prepilin-type N-terminal cleavage/methylation domain-containing protein
VSRRQGLTLIEVVAGLALLGGLLSGILMAYGRHVVQVRHAELRLQATAAADRLLALWFGGFERGLRRHGDGRVPGDKRLRWRTHLLDLEQA